MQHRHAYRFFYIVRSDQKETQAYVAHKRFTKLWRSDREREREERSLFAISWYHNTNTNAMINSNNGRLPERKFHHSWPPLIIITNNDNNGIIIIIIIIMIIINKKTEIVSNYNFISCLTCARIKPASKERSHSPALSPCLFDNICIHVRMYGRV